MARFVSFEVDPSGGVVCVNPSRVLFVAEVDGRTTIGFALETYVQVRGSVEDVARKLSEDAPDGAP